MNPFGWQFNVKGTMNLNTVISHIPAVLSTYWLYVLDLCLLIPGCLKQRHDLDVSSCHLKRYHNLHCLQKLCFILLSIGGNCFACLSRQWYNACLFFSMYEKFRLVLNGDVPYQIEGNNRKLGFVQWFSDNFTMQVRWILQTDSRIYSYYELCHQFLVPR